MSGWDFLEGNDKRIGARVIENAKLRQPPPPRDGPSPFDCAHVAHGTWGGHSIAHWRRPARRRPRQQIRNQQSRTHT
eukprot:1070897-Prymnesium_polylepis.1